jgi:riboflavin synthase
MPLPKANRIAISGIRDLTVADIALIEKTMTDLLATPRTDIIFGGARGTDTIALIAAGKLNVPNMKLTVIVPGVVSQQPVAAQEAIRQYAHDVIELGLTLSNKQVYQVRNIKMLSEAESLLAFWHGRPGGTANCIKAARIIKLPVDVVWVKGL